MLLNIKHLLITGLSLNVLILLNPSTRKHFFNTLVYPLIFQCSDKLGLTLEMGSFAAGVMISTTEFTQHTLDQVCLFFETNCAFMLCHSS